MDVKIIYLYHRESPLEQKTHEEDIKAMRNAVSEIDPDSKPYVFYNGLGKRGIIMIKNSKLSKEHYITAISNYIEPEFNYRLMDEYLFN
jgi:hypothetical protein